VDRDAAFRMRFWPSVPERALTDSGFAGEVTVAWLRVLLALALLVSIGLWHLPTNAVDRITLAGVAVLLAGALAVLAVARRGALPRWWSLATSVFDVTVLSGITAAYIASGRGDLALSARFVYPAYFLVLAATCLRYDVRLCLLTGLTAVVQYAILLAWAVTRIAPTTTGIAWSEELVRVVLLAMAAGLAAIIVQKSRHLRLLSTHDALTGVYSRGYFDERISEEVLRARRYRRPLALALIDLDHFKAVNDRRGHSAGDAALRRFAEILHTSVRRTDIVARYGGEEFVIVFPETGPYEARAKLERIRVLVESTPIRVSDGGGDIWLTFSAGFAHYPADGDTREALVHNADVHLMAAKDQGRNRIMGSDVPLRDDQKAAMPG
jgi:diguanylate cyclase (GGDEF)-like protein